MSSPNPGVGGYEQQIISLSFCPQEKKEERDNVHCRYKSLIISVFSSILEKQKMSKTNGGEKPKHEGGETIFFLGEKGANSLDRIDIFMRLRLLSLFLEGKRNFFFLSRPIALWA